MYEEEKHNCNMCCISNFSFGSSPCIDWKQRNSVLYGENSINEAFDVIEEKFAKDFEGCTLTELRYDKDVENGFAEEIEKYHKENNQLGVLITYQRFCFIHASSSTFELFACATHSLY